MGDHDLQFIFWRAVLMLVGGCALALLLAGWLAGRASIGGH